ncbi:hypothetical protein CICLE_v10024144mg, partial [Citrus x clementina]
MSFRTDQRLNEAAQARNVDALYELIWEDAYFLDQIDRVPFVDTPLHIAASMGHVNFALEIMRLKPSFARKQNQYGFSPLHLALQNSHTQMVLRLIDVNRNLVHVTIRKETVLHVAAKNDKFEVLKVMLGWLRYVNKDDIINRKDDEGNILLHISISRKSTVHNFGGREGSSLATVEIADYLKRGLIWRQKVLLFFYRSSLSITDENRNALLVVAILITTATFQAALTPPQDLWGNNSNNTDFATNVAAT